MEEERSQKIILMGNSSTQDQLKTQEKDGKTSSRRTG